MGKSKTTFTETTIPAGYTLDYISGKQIKETKKEQVCQRVARALIYEYGFSPEDMALDFPIGGRQKVDVAIFAHNKPHSIENLSRVVLCRPEPKIGRNAIRIRDVDQAAKDLEGLQSVLCEVEAVTYGLWTNGLEFFFWRRNRSVLKLYVTLLEIGPWRLRITICR